MEHKLTREKTMYGTIYDNTRTTDLMSEFEGPGYDYLVIGNYESTMYKGRLWEYHFIIEEKWAHDFYGKSITMTQFRRNYCSELKNYAKEQLHRFLDANDDLTPDSMAEVWFEKPCRLRAASWYHTWGDTNYYAFTGVLIVRYPSVIKTFTPCESI